MYRLNFGIVRLLFENLEGISCWPRWPEHNFGNDRQQREKNVLYLQTKTRTVTDGKMLDNLLCYRAINDRVKTIR